MTALEPHVKKTYARKFNRTDFSFNCKDIGLVLFKQYPYLEASPDVTVEHTCYVKDSVKIKYPSSVAGEKPSYTNYDHLEVTESGYSRLKENCIFLSNVQPNGSNCIKTL